jgi:uncharacterized protein (UPF0147 family)
MKKTWGPHNAHSTKELRDKLREALKQIDSDERIPTWIRSIARAALEAKS